MRRAEGYYQRIGEDIGYSRTNKMWTWEDRVQIFLFATQKSFVENTGQPLWSTGYADRDSRLFKSKTIITFKQEESFADGLLPHEISHLILHDFVSNSTRIPIWFDEGVAQMQEKDKRLLVKAILQRLASQAQTVPFDQFVNWDIRKEKDASKARIFYAQSLSVVDYLVAEFGHDAFARFCRALRDDKNFEQAFFSVYRAGFSNFNDLGKKWIASLN